MKHLPVYFFMISASLFADLKTVSVDFTRIQTRSNSDNADTVRGALYTFDGRMIIKVVSPIIQFMIFDSMKTRIYNPNEKAGVELQLKNRSFMPCFQTFIGFLQGGDLSPRLNFRISESIKRGDSLVTRWVPQDKKSRFRGVIEMVYFRDRPVRTTTLDKNNKPIAQMRFSQDTLINNRHVPLCIVSTTMADADSVKEEVVFYNAATGKIVPAEIRDFMIPPDIRLKVIEW